MRGEKDINTFYEIKGDINVGDLAPDKTQFRPHVVWFNEQVPMIEQASIIMSTADTFILAGTSLQVYPAAGLIDLVPAGVTKYIIDRKIPAIRGIDDLYLIEKPATEGVGELKRLLNCS